MKIVVLDGHTLNPGDLSWEPLLALGPCDIHDRTPKANVVTRAIGAQIALTNKTVLDREAIAQLMDLRYIGVLATGYDIVDIEAARARRIPVTNVPGYGTASVVQMTFALVLELANHVGLHNNSVHAGGWVNSPDFCYWEKPLVELVGLTFGVIGFGQIGRSVAGIAQAFGMKVLVCTRTVPPMRPENLSFVDLRTLLTQSDIVSLHCPLTPETRHLINRERLAWMQPGALLINTSRGGLIDEAAAAEALRERRLGGAAVDVLSAEPPFADNPLLRAPNCIITPHIAWASRAARARLLEVAVANLKGYLTGRAQNVVNNPV